MATIPSVSHLFIFDIRIYKSKPSSSKATTSLRIPNAPIVPP